jgi:uncharacterized protein (DUF2147 family)
MRIRAVSVVFLLAATTAFGADPNDIIGQWQTDGGRSSIEIVRCGEKLCGKVVGMMHPNYLSGKDGPVGTPKLDGKNPDPALRNRPIIGLQVIDGLTATGANRWEHGTCYDPESGNRYKCKMHLEKPDRLEVRGFIGISLLGRTYVLTREKDHPSAQTNTGNP